MRRIVAALLCLTCLASAGRAAETGGDSAPATGDIYMQSLSGRAIGGTALDNFSTGGDSALTGLSTLGSPSMGAAVGWQPMESLRLELEYASRGRDRVMLPPSVDVAGTGSVSLMANALFDVKVTDWLTPYVGFGVGWTRQEADRVNASLSTDVRGEVFAYQGIIGLSVPFTSRLSFFADGRYLRTGDFAAAAADEFAAHSNVQTWSALAGIRFTFGK